MAQEPVVAVQEGQLRGKVNDGFRGGQYYSFQGIPYAKPPVGELRFKAPRPVEPWTGIKDATVEGSECYSRHMVFQHFIGSEDCLFLNVFTPQLPTEKSAQRPVMVWIHGGGFTSGSGNIEFYGPDFLVAEDVVLVTINYRLGLIGFLNFDDPSLKIPGNAGLKDQVMALKWIQKNIAQFGGDANNVTIFGESAGGASVHYLMLSPLAKGLFHKVIAQSGSALGCWAKGQRSAPLIAKVLELETTNEKEVFKAIVDLPMEKLLEIQEKIPDAFIASAVRPFGPVVEKGSEEPVFLSEDPLAIVTSGKFNKVPFMLGFTTREGMLSEIITKNKYGEVKLVEDFERAVPHMLNLRPGSEASLKVAQTIKSFYYGDEQPALENIDLYYLLQTDNFFLRALHATVKQHLEASSTPIYVYRMSVESTLNIFKRFGQIKNPGVCHADDLGYLFKNALTPPIRPGSIEDLGLKRFCKLWATFARTSNPNLHYNESLINVVWKPAEKNKHHFLDIGENLTVGVNPEATRMSFWDKIYGQSSVASKL